MDEAFACHLCRLRQSHDVEDGRCHIGQDSVLHGCILVLSHINEWNRVERVGCVRSSVWVDGVVSISVVCDDDGFVAGDYIADLVVEDKIIIELKAVSALTQIHEMQLINYLH